MGLVITFPDVWRETRSAKASGEPAAVIILPVVRIERPKQAAAANARPATRRRKRPASRS